MCLYNLFLFTLCWGQVIREVSRARPSIPVGVHELAVVLSLSKRISYTVERLCKTTQQCSWFKGDYLHNPTEISSAWVGGGADTHMFADALGSGID